MDFDELQKVKEGANGDVLVLSIGAMIMSGQNAIKDRHRSFLKRSKSPEEKYGELIHHQEMETGIDTEVVWWDKGRGREKERR
ncbi:hypothetical protein SAY86_007857 [Trapa natans]|uniref:Uncharacterized protein n=1 Tax=Trapa natans TaxID=22666 RepID=A0AAN7R2K0_TRANT|nr:hypothetical protein SAY86_007857 [Trapa natans]